ncbi:MAG: hypothetical protein ACI94Y_002848 [Maribacter sp.]|jgi:hypothetical protein
MLFRALVLAAVIGMLFFLFKQVYSQFNFNKCEYCDGKGHWKGTRGEKNHCKICNGTGKE